jgi:hypothetical protein
MKRALLPVALLFMSGCAYYNGIYNAERAAKTAERQWMRGEYLSAADSFRVSATHAETVLARFDRSRWRTHALYLAARGAALGNECGRAAPRLAEYLALPAEPVTRRAHARVALASCLLTENKNSVADSVLRPLIDDADPVVRQSATLFSARAALAQGEPERAQQMLARIPGTAASWENLGAAMLAGDHAAAERLLAARATVGDWRSEVPRHMRTLWAAERRAGVVAIADRYARSRAPVNDRAQLLLLTSDLTATRGDTATARRMALEARRIGLTAAYEGPVAARLLALDLSGTREMVDVRERLKRDSVLARRTPQLERIRHAVLLIELCLKRADRFGAGLYLAAEFARDSLRATELAHTFFRQVERDYPESPIAARALVAAALMIPDSSAVYQARALANWPTAGVSAVLRGVSPRDSSTAQGEDVALNQSFIVVTNQFRDSLRAWVRADSTRRADSVAAILRSRGRGP